MIDGDGFRPNVGIVLCNRKGQVLWARRYGQHSWQFPQGGVDDGESPEQSMYRELYEEIGVYTRREIEARNEIKLEKYSTNIAIEARVLGDIARNHIIPSALKYQNRLIDNVKGLKDIFGDKQYEELAKEQINLIKSISGYVATMKVEIDRLFEAKDKASNEADSYKMAVAFCNDVKPIFEKIREASDALEMMVDDELWPLTKYRELLFTR